MFDEFATDANKSRAPQPTHAGAPPDSERAKQPPPESPYKPYSEKPAPTDALYEPYANKPALHDPPYEPYKDI